MEQNFREVSLCHMCKKRIVILIIVSAFAFLSVACNKGEGKNEINYHAKVFVQEFVSKVSHPERLQIHSLELFINSEEDFKFYYMTFSAQNWCQENEVFEDSFYTSSLYVVNMDTGETMNIYWPNAQLFPKISEYFELAKLSGVVRVFQQNTIDGFLEES